MPINISRLTREFIHWPLTTTNDLTEATAELAYMEDQSDLPTESDWNEGELLEVSGGWRVRSLVGPDHANAKDLTPSGQQEQDYQAWMRIEDSPELIVRRVGVITVE